MHVLIVEDDPSLVAALALVLAHAGHATVQCATVEEGREELERKFFDAVLLDAGVRGGGCLFWEELEASDAYGGRAILLSGSASTVERLEGRAQVFLKPCDYDELLAELGRIPPRVDAPSRP